MPDTRRYRVTAPGGTASVTTAPITPAAAKNLETALNETAAAVGGNPTSVTPLESPDR